MRLIFRGVAVEGSPEYEALERLQAAVAEAETLGIEQTEYLPALEAMTVVGGYTIRFVRKSCRMILWAQAPLVLMAWFMIWISWVSAVVITPIYMYLSFTGGMRYFRNRASLEMLQKTHAEVDEQLRIKRAETRG